MTAIEFLRRYRPNSLVKSSARGEYQLAEHDSFKINGESSVWHWKSRDIGGKSALKYLIYAIVCGGLLMGKSCVCGYAVIRQDEQTLCAPIIDGSTRIYGEISGNVVCRGNAVVLPGTKLDNRTQDCFVLEDDRVSVQTASRTPPPKEPRTHDFER